MAVRVGVPLRQDEHRRARRIVRRCGSHRGIRNGGDGLRGKKSRVDGVVRLVRRGERARKREHAAVARCGERVVGGRRRGEERVGVAHHMRDPAGEHIGRPLDVARGKRTARAVACRNPVEPPVERPHDAIGRRVRQPPFPRVEERLKHSRPMLYCLLHARRLRHAKAPRAQAGQANELCRSLCARALNRYQRQRLRGRPVNPPRRLFAF